MDTREKVTPVPSSEASPTLSARDYWMSRLATLPPAPELPVSVSAASAQPELTRRQFRLDEKTWKSLKDRASQAGFGAVNVLVAAFAEVLAVWSKSPHFTLKLALGDRVVNLLELDNSKPESFETRVRRQQEQLRQDLEHDVFNGAEVMRELALLQGSPSAPVMPVLFTSLLEGGSEKDLVAASGKASPVAWQQVYLHVTIRDDRGTLYVCWDAADEMFPPELLDDMFGAYQTLLGQLSRDQVAWGRTLADNTRKLLPPKQARLFEEVNHTQAPASDEFLHTLFLKQVEEKPDQLAICTPMRRMTYGELYTRACRIEEELLPRGLEPNQFAGIVMEPGWEQVVAAMGILFAGGAYMPIDPDLPPERQRYLIENGDVKVVLTQSSVQHRLGAPHDVEILLVDQMEPLEGRPTTAPRTRQKREDLAYNIYTSGSTGQPKGVIVDHCAAVNTILDINERFGVGPGDRVLALSRLSFDLSVYDIFGLLAAGGTVVIPSPERAHDPAHWVELVASEKVTIWDTVPALTDLLVEQAEHGDVMIQSLRLILMSGDWIPLGLPGRIRKLLPNAEVVSLGGATEAAIWSILYPIQEVDAKWKSVPYGKPMRNQIFHVLNYGEAPCPVWVPGELYIGGAGLARGYWRDAQKTAASFIYHKSTGERLYRTGDWGRYLPDGNIEFLGREDFQVKLKGNRIELGEIEAKLLEHESVDVGVVLAREDTPGEKRLVAYVIPKSGKTVQEADLRDFLSAKLADYMVPSAFVFMEQFPLTTNGKLNRRALPPR